MINNKDSTYLIQQTAAVMSAMDPIIMHKDTTTAPNDTKAHNYKREKETDKKTLSKTVLLIQYHSKSGKLH